MKLNAIVILVGGLEKKKGHWRSSRFAGPVFASHLRVLAGHYLWEKNPNQVILVCGGKGYLQNIRKAPNPVDITAKELIALGVDPKKIIKVKGLNNTYQSLPALRKFIVRFHKIFITSNAYHLRVRAFLKKDKILNRYFEKGKIKIISAEKVVSKYNPKFADKIKNLYNSPKMKLVIAKEKAGIIQIKNGTYNFWQNTSQSGTYK